MKFVKFLIRASVWMGMDANCELYANNRVHANLIHHYAKHMYDVAGIYTLGAQPKSYLTENCVHSIYSPGYAHDRIIGFICIQTKVLLLLQ